ncbi:hypothetical protein QZJ86_12080 [Methylomonas montana]|uniref:hypothetical protein n=1 Tax=Methylomonas montana TaxID=3058963 RepID=UPI002658C2E2|nr:hypothetical protein [Methylomonas montana]WKJ88760.1 hypothetical protein QZJ86_12080 [Methylomonas montana]
MINRDEMRVLLEEFFEESARINAVEHSEHHAWIQERIEAEKARKEMCWEITKAVAQWSVLGIAGALWFWIKNGHWPQ